MWFTALVVQNLGYYAIAAVFIPTGVRNTTFRMTTKDAIENRRSIRKYHATSVPESAVTAMLHAARLAPSGGNTQPWRFKAVSDEDTRAKLATAANGQKFLASAPVVIVCCADIDRYLQAMTHQFPQRAALLRAQSRDEIGLRAAVHVAIAIEHMVLRALDFELGTCWVRSLNEHSVHEIFGWSEQLYVIALLSVGYPAEFPPPRPRLRMEDILL